jgi:hypothetical protein
LDLEGLVHKLFTSSATHLATYLENFDPRTNLDLQLPNVKLRRYNPETLFTTKSGKQQNLALADEPRDPDKHESL